MLACNPNRMSNLQLITLISTILGSGLVLGKMILDLQGRMSAVESRLSHMEGLLEGFCPIKLGKPRRVSFKVKSCR